MSKTKKLDSKYLLPARSYDLYTEGLQAIMEKNHVSLDEATRLALEDIAHTHSEEHIHLVKAAYKKLKEGE